MPDLPDFTAPATSGSRDVLPPGVEKVVADYINGGAGEGDTLRMNVAAWQRWSIVPRVLRDLSTIDTGVDLFGRRLVAPIIAAPWGDHSLLHPEAELASARGATAAGIGFGLSSTSSILLDAVGQVSGPYLQQLYIPQDRERVKFVLDTAMAGGAWGFALTVDAPTVGAQLPFRTNLDDRFGTPSPNWPGGSPMGAANDLGPEDIAWVAQYTGLPVLAKGVIHPDDARLAVEAGAAGVIVSNHGGRQIDGSLTSAEALPEVVDAIGATSLVFVDGGIRRPEDVFRALALGADAVMLGRPAAWALARGGAEEIERTFTELVGRFTGVMASAGAATISDITRDMVRWRNWG